MWFILYRYMYLAMKTARIFFLSSFVIIMPRYQRLSDELVKTGIFSLDLREENRIIRNWKMTCQIGESPNEMENIR